jgi:hypothetical protein
VNALAARDNGAPYLDASLADMGKGGGNLSLELIAAYLRSRAHQPFEMAPLARAASDLLARWKGDAVSPRGDTGSRSGIAGGPERSSGMVRPRVVVVGAGFAGYQAARTLGRLSRALGICGTGSVNANLRRYAAASALAQAGLDWLERLISRRVPLDRFGDALAAQPEDIKVALTLI